MKSKKTEKLLKFAEGLRKLSADEKTLESARQTLLETIAAKEKKPTPIPNIGLAFIQRTIMKNKITKLATAAVVVVLAVCWLTVSDRGKLEQQGTNEPAVAVRSKTPAELVSVISLNMVFRDGDMEAMEEQFDKAEKKVKPGLKERITMEQLICKLEDCEKI
jgi:hypothetical protein